MIKHPYVSCIKLNGKPILPPLITSERRKEINMHKQQAIKLEQRLKNCRALRKHLNDLLTTRCLIESPNLDGSFGDSHIEALEIPNFDKGAKKLVHLNKDIVEVTEYVGDTVKVIVDRSELKSNCDNCENPETSLVSNVMCKNESKVEPELLNKPRLIRSNSYTLEAPSPLLLAHLRKISDCSQGSTDRLRSSSESGGYSSINTVYQNDNSKLEEIKSPTIEVFQTDISVQQIMVNTNKPEEANTTKEQKRATFFMKDPFDVLDADCEFMKVLKEIPENYADQIMELVRKQQSEQQQRLDRYDCNYSPDESNMSPLSATEKTKPRSRIRRSSTFSMSPSQSIHYSLSESDTLTAPNTPPLKLIDLENRCEVLNTSSPSRKSTWKDNLKHLEISRELFPATQNREAWAASIIGAHVKGYLTRRLLRTERVQKLIETIRDVLMCALELHRSDHIDAKDVELHRRLIQQISAACYAFHDIFFDLSIRDQMQIIANDRQRKIDRLKRTLSAKRPSSAKSTTRSLGSQGSIDLPASKHTISMSQSATKV
ncbi:centriolar coiled-coil protein of 110 kDa [Cylas formicarius]|uniref:centriolar coiled-coil protein of 110 kDa n=1 Tax=Cylas formicarius TaxID=197179 RepID=UPI0029584930|nr:centriolar coiled-coil protein of 110 kDa [Cylas formicarius]XP_060519289.1 centriolar coiled-coil protein of 110 kDa [Cylas formicarius]